MRELDCALVNNCVHCSLPLLVMVTSCLVGPCLSGAPHEPGVSPLRPEGSGLCQGWGCQLPDPVAPRLICPRQEQTPSGTGTQERAVSMLLRCSINAGSKSTFLPPGTAALQEPGPPICSVEDFLSFRGLLPCLAYISAVFS